MPDAIGIRLERPADHSAITDVTTRAFAAAEHSSGTEAAIIAALRRASALSLSLVAEQGDELVGHAAFSPVTIGVEDGRWFGLGPVSVRPDRQRRGIGAALIADGLERLRASNAGGCVVLGDPDYYRRFGFEADPGLRYAGAPPEYFLRIAFSAPVPAGQVGYHAAFGVQ